MTTIRDPIPKLKITFRSGGSEELRIGGKEGEQGVHAKAFANPLSGAMVGRKEVLDVDTSQMINYKLRNTREESEKFPDFQAYITTELTQFRKGPLFWGKKKREHCCSRGTR